MAAASEKPDWKLPPTLWQAEQLGEAIPPSPHACSVAMPLWEHNVGYEEGDEAVISKFSAGYPRFFVNPLVTELKSDIASELNLEATNTLLAPSQRSAQRAAAYVGHRTEQDAEVVRTRFGVWLVRTNKIGAPALQEFWQHAGEIVSSRTAARCLDGAEQIISPTESKREIRERVAALQHVDPEDVYLFPSGMAAIYAAWRIANRGGRCVQYGFPYVDTFKILQRFGKTDPRLFMTDSEDGFGDPLFASVSEKFSAVFCEVPGNPLLRVPDVGMLRKLANMRGFALIIDDTLGAMINTDLRPYADLIATSLTKFFSGAGDVLAGSLIVVPGQPRYDEFKQALENDYEDLFADEDANVLANNSADTVARVQQINTTTQALVQTLREHPQVARVFYPDQNPARFDAVRDQHFESGCGGLMSLLLKDAERQAPRMYDALQITKGPNLGTNFTLCCPYTILAHYDELEFAEQCGVSRYLLRISVGLEDPAWLTHRILAAIPS